MVKFSRVHLNICTAAHIFKKKYIGMIRVKKQNQLKYCVPSNLDTFLLSADFLNQTFSGDKNSTCPLVITSEI